MLPHMLAFSFRSIIADTDSTVIGEPHHPSVVLVLELDEDFIRVIVPDNIAGGRRELLSVNRRVRVVGEVEECEYGPRHVASELQLLDGLH
jgi:hypothetical protein